MIFSQSISFAADSAAVNNFLGDVDGDGFVTARDAVNVLKYAARLIDSFPIQDLFLQENERAGVDLSADLKLWQKIADFNEDGYITTYDSVLILNYVAGLTDIVPHIYEMPNGLSVYAGDADCDGFITPQDAALVLKYAARIIDKYTVGSLSVFNKNENRGSSWADYLKNLRLLADVDGDEYITTYDAVYILRYAAGIIDKFPAENIQDIFNGKRIDNNWSDVTYAIDNKDNTRILFFSFDENIKDAEFDISKARIGYANVNETKGTVDFAEQGIRLSDNYYKAKSESEMVPGTYYTEINPMNGTFFKVMLSQNDTERIDKVFDINKIYDETYELTPVFTMDSGFYGNSSPVFVVIEAGKKILTINNFEEEPKAYYMLYSNERGVHTVYEKINLSLDCNKLLFCTKKKVLIKEVTIDDNILSSGVDFNEIHG